MIHRCLTAGALVAVCCAAAAVADTTEAVTRPSKDVTFSFVRSGRVAAVLVKPGQAVKTGDVLVRLDDTVDQARIKQLEAQAADETRIKAAQARMDQSKVDLQKTEEVFKRGAATKLEVEHARLEVLINKLALDLAKFQQQQDKLKLDEARKELKQMTLTSSIDGLVQGVYVEVGEAVDPQRKIARVVSIDPLWVDVDVDKDQAANLRIGQAARVGPVDAAANASPMAGKVTFIAAVINAATVTRTVRLEISNKQTPPRPAGQRVSVAFVPPNPPDRGPAPKGKTDGKEQ